jgi:hypothetical protein
VCFPIRSLTGVGVCEGGQAGGTRRGVVQTAARRPSRRGGPVEALALTILVAGSCAAPRRGTRREALGGGPDSWER